MAPEFTCQKCGQCCSHIRGIIPEEDKEFIKKFAYGKLPLTQLISIEKMTFPLYDWEAKRFMKWQNGIDAKIKPLRVVFDLNTNKTIIVSYFMDSGSCPFLKEGKCIIYDKKRAFVCRMFPFNKSPIIKTGEETKKESLFGECPAVEEIKESLPGNTEEMAKFLDKAFPDGSFINAIQNDIVTEWQNKKIIELIKNKKIRPAMNYPYSFLLKRINNSKKVDFTNFLVAEGIITREEMEKLIKRFDNNLDAIEKIR